MRWALVPQGWCPQKRRRWGQRPCGDPGRGWPSACPGEASGGTARPRPALGLQPPDWEAIGGRGTRHAPPADQLSGMKYARGFRQEGGRRPKPWENYKLTRKGQDPTRTQGPSGQRLISERAGRTAWDRRGGGQGEQGTTACPQWKPAPEGLEPDVRSSSRAAGTPRGSTVSSQPGSL